VLGENCVQNEQSAKSTLIPRFSLKWLLGFTAVAAGVSFLLSQAVNRQAWALGVVIALESLVLVFAVYAWFFAVAWLFALLRRALAPPPRASSPFASAGPPAQLVPPRQPE
jgi:hypothetical protein